MLSSLFSALAAASKFLPALWTSFPVRVRGACPSLAAAPAVRPAGLPLPLCCSGPARPVLLSRAQGAVPLGVSVE